MPATCPVCDGSLRTAPGASEPRLLECGLGHGVFVAPAEVERIVDATARRRLQGLVDQGLPASRGCPACGTVLRAFEVQRVDAWGCPACGAVWFDRGPVEDHVRRVRRRAYGRSSIAARRDVVELGENIQADEVVRGLLAYYALEPRGSSKKD